MISVIIPTYNRPEFTQRAVKGVLAQTYRDLEVVVVDDCSREPLTEADLGGDPRVRVIRHEANRGVGTARNTGVRESRGDMLAFLDSDDYWFPDKLASQMAIYEKQADKANCFIYSSYYYEKDGKWVPEPPGPMGENETLSDYLFIRHGDVHTSTWLASKALFLANPTNEKLLRHQDVDLLLRLAVLGVRFIHCPTLAGVRAADLRTDRLSTAPVVAMRRMFLDENARRMTVPSSVIMEAAFESLATPNDSFLQKHRKQISYIMKTPRLDLPQKVSLASSYISVRVFTKIRRRQVQRMPEKPYFES